MQQTRVRPGKTLPQLFRDVGHEWMQQPQRLLEDREQTSSGRSSFRRSFFCSHASLRQLDVPVTEIIPEEVIECLYRFMKLITGQRTADVSRCLIQARNNPPIVQR